MQRCECNIRRTACDNNQKSILYICSIRRTRSFAKRRLAIPPFERLTKMSQRDRKRKDVLTRHVLINFKARSTSTPDQSPSISHMQNAQYKVRRSVSPL